MSASADEFKTVPQLGATELGASVARGESDGEKEAAAVAAGTLEEQSRILTQSLRKHTNLAILVLIWLSVILVGMALIVAVFHHLSPWGWLTDSVGHFRYISI